MHIPDGLLSPEIWVLMWAFTIILVGYATSKVNDRLAEKKVPLVGVLAAFIFAAQMLNAPIFITPNVSGHMLGGVLAAAFLGPMTASIIMATVFSVQGIFFQDGGITALGANTFNMGLIGTIGGYYIYTGIKSMVKGTTGMFLALGIAAWLSVVLASAATAIEIAASGIIELGVVLPAMVGIHSLIGLIEAGITIAVAGFVLKSRPDLLEMEKI